MPFLLTSELIVQFSACTISYQINFVDWYRMSHYVPKYRGILLRKNVHLKLFCCGKNFRE